MAELYCSFCGKSENDVLFLVASLPSLICDECALLAVQVIFERYRSRLPARQAIPADFGMQDTTHDH